MIKLVVLLISPLFPKNMDRFVKNIDPLLYFYDLHTVSPHTVILDSVHEFLVMEHSGKLPGFFASSESRAGLAGEGFSPSFCDTLVIDATHT